MLIAGGAFTLILSEAVFEQPLPSVPVTVKMLLEVGEAITVAPLEAFNEVDGLHEYEFPPLAVNVVDLPEQIVVEPAVRFIVGFVLTVIVVVVVLVHPLALVPVTVYVVVRVGDAVTEAPVVPESAVLGPQL